ncbi:15963_t:CDS:2, partial [Funneliformis geosporum]
IGTLNGRIFNAGPSSNMTRNKAKKINEYFFHDIIPSQPHENVNTGHENEKSTLSSPSQDEQENYIGNPEYFDKLIDNVDLSYIGGEEEPVPSPPK